MGKNSDPETSPVSPRVKLFVPPHNPVDNAAAHPTSLTWLGQELWFNTRTNFVVRSTTDGSMVPVPTPDFIASFVAAGPDGNVWFVGNNSNAVWDRIGYVTPAGSVKYFAVENVPADFEGLVAGRDGAMWFTMHQWDTGAGKVLLGRVSMDGVVSIRQLGAGPSSGLTRGPDGSLWVLNYTKVHRIALDSTVTSFDVPDELVVKGTPTIGGDGNIWMEGGKPLGPAGVLRMTPDGTFTQFAFPAFAEPFKLAMGPDVVMWITALGPFPGQTGPHPSIVRMGLDGTILERIELGRISVWDIVPGPDGRMWAIAMGPLDDFGEISYIARIDP